MSERDELIARALADLPVPDHGPTFWDDLDRRMDDPIEPAAAAAAAARAADPPVHRLDTSELPSVTALAERRSRRSRRTPVLAAAAAIVILVVAVGVVASLATGGDDDGTELADEPGDATTTVPNPEPTTTALGATMSTPNLLSTDTPSGTVTTWLQAIGSGDIAAATALTGPLTAAYASSSMDGLEAYLTSEQASFAALAELPETDISVIPAAVFASSGQNVSVVVIDATDAGAAHDGPALEVFPVVDAGDGWKVEPLALNPDIENRVIVQSPRAGSGQDGGLGVMDADAAVEVIMPATGTVVFRLDDLEPFSRQTTGVGANDDPYARYDPQGTLSNGTHTLVIVGVGEDGTIVSVAGPFTVTGGESTTTTGRSGSTGTTATTGATGATTTTEP